MIEHILENNHQNLNLVLSLLHAHKSIYPLKLFLNLPCNLNKTDREQKGIQKKEETKSYLKLERECSDPLQMTLSVGVCNWQLGVYFSKFMLTANE